MAPTAALLMFAIMYFGIMIDVGLFDPLIRLITRVLGDDPAKVVLGTALLAGAVSLDGDGSTTFIITTSAMLPIYLRLGMSPVVLTCVAGLNGTLNIVPWGGPTVRAASALSLQPTDIFVPMLPSLATGLVISLAFAWFLGLGERRRLAARSTPRASSRPAATGSSARSPLPRRSSRSPVPPRRAPATSSPSGRAMRSRHRARGCRRHGHGRHHARPEPATLRPRLIWFNLALTVAVMVLLVLDLFPLAFVFMVGAAIALIVNFPKLKSQATRSSRTPSIVGVVSMVLAAGVLVGVLNGTGMVTAMASWITAVIPAEMGPFLAVITGVLSIPFTFFMSNDAFYFGILPVLAERLALRHRTRRDGARLHHRAARASAEPARPGDPAGVAGERQPRRSPQEGAVAGRVSLAMLAVGVLVGVIPLAA
jgi:CitMHS family citrate-Mg2+:H+ or citrate-Ca2+:H+ symporter